MFQNNSVFTGSFQAFLCILPTYAEIKASNWLKALFFSLSKQKNEKKELLKRTGLIVLSCGAEVMYVCHIGRKAGEKVIATFVTAFKSGPENMNCFAGLRVTLFYFYVQVKISGKPAMLLLIYIFLVPKRYARMNEIKTVLIWPVSFDDITMSMEYLFDKVDYSRNTKELLQNG